MVNQDNDKKKTLLLSFCFISRFPNKVSFFFENKVIMVITNIAILDIKIITDHFSKINLLILPKKTKG